MHRLVVVGRSAGCLIIVAMTALLSLATLTAVYCVVEQCLRGESHVAVVQKCTISLLVVSMFLRVIFSLFVSPMGGPRRTADGSRSGPGTCTLSNDLRHASSGFALDTLSHCA